MVIYMNLKKQELTLHSGKTVLVEYDQDGDMLEIIFREGEATCAIELTESIILRFDWETSEPLSLSFISYSHLLRPNRYGEVHFQLLTDQWPKEAHDKIWNILQSTLLSEFLELSTYAPANSRELIPMTAIKRPYLPSLAA